MEKQKRGLSPREVEVLSNVAGGFGYKEIAQKLNISERTIQTHIQRIYLKLGATNGANAILIATRQGLTLQEVV